MTFCINSEATTINWTGATNNSWSNTANWSPSQIPTSADDVQIGVTVSFTNSPVVSSSTTIKSLTFGSRTSGSLTINSGITLTVTGDITQRHSGSNSSVTTSILGQTVAGVLGGTITCNGSLYVGDNTAPPTPTSLQLNVTNTTNVEVAIQTFNIAQNVVVNTTSSSASVLLANSSNVNNPTLDINNGSIIIGQNIVASNSNYVSTARFGYTTATNKAQFISNPTTNTITGSIATISFGGTLTIGTNALVDFYGAGPGQSITIYTGTSPQTIYTAATTGIGIAPYTYQTLNLIGTGTKTFQSGTLTIPGNWSTSGGKVDLTTNSTAIKFNGASQTITDAGSDNGNGLVFSNVNFEGSGTKTLSGKFAVASTAVLTMGGTATLATGGNLTLNSDATGSASVAIIPSGTSITGNVNVQRFIKGSSTSLTKRGYRLISSPVYTGSPGGYRSFDLQYLLNDAYISGASGGGFNSPTGTNPSLYLFREDISASNSAFTSGNFKGITKINNTNAYDIGTQKRFTLTNVADTTTNLPIGNGVLFFFRGNKADNTTQSGSKVVSPYDYPEDVTFTQVGALNTGRVNVKLWFRSNTNLSYTNSASISNSGVRGHALVGNPYASTINFEKFNRNGTSSTIYGSGFPAASVTQGKIWVFNPTTKQYDSYQQTTTPTFPADTTSTIRPTGSLYTGDGSNMIASGQGFFIKATSTSQTLTFHEAAKTTTQPTAANLIRVMSTRNDMASLNSNAPVKLKPILRLKIIKDSVSTDDVVLAFNDKTPNTFSDDDDVEDLGGNGALVSLSLLSSDNVSTAIKQMQLPEAGQEIIRMAADATTSGLYQLKLAEMQNMPKHYDLWLKDAFTGDSLDLKNNDTYNFNIYKNNPATFGSKRFTLIIRKNPAFSMRTLGFHAQKTASGSRLTWMTENEGTDYRFAIHRSIDEGLSYKNIGQISSTGKGDYLYIDVDPVKGKNTYRVGIENINTGLVSYTNAITLLYTDTTTNNIATVSAYPNPTVQMVNVKITDTNKKVNESYTISILSSSGRLMKRTTTSKLTWQENVAELLPGTYLVQVINNTAGKVEGETKFVKL